jgi:hypothetical protein
VIEYRYELVVPRARRDEVRTAFAEIGGEPVELLLHEDGAMFLIDTPALSWREARRWRKSDERELRAIAAKHDVPLTRMRIRTV